MSIGSVMSVMVLLVVAGRMPGPSVPMPGPDGDAAPVPAGANFTCFEARLSIELDHQASEEFVGGPYGATSRFCAAAPTSSDWSAPP
ncbi:hypothetical protein [Frondihabitans sp. PAMC 28766]|uniref:hypothetical protein n=1 Tax=Frondihabitans sp. PAMC 28766 TaxID=1795630 RepID=UPI0012FFB0DC|nr:hypothetical protein [Frondihabitans sp. PAMC 28766]